MKKLLLSLFAISGIFLLTGCSLTGTTNKTTVDTTSGSNNQISLLQQQISGLNAEIQELKEQNDELITENETIKTSLSVQNSGENILASQNEELKKNIEEYKQNIEKYKQALVQEKLKNKQQNIKTENTGSTTTNQWYITEAYNNLWKNYIKIDYTENGQIWPSWAPEIINNNPLIRTFEVSNTAVFKVLKYNSDWRQELQNITRDEFKLRSNSDFASLNPDPMNPSYYWAGKTSLVKIQHDTQQIYEITEIYRP